MDGNDMITRREFFLLPGALLGRDEDYRLERLEHRIDELQRDMETEVARIDEALIILVMASQQLIERQNTSPRRQGV